MINFFKLQCEDVSLSQYPTNTWLGMPRLGLAMQGLFEIFVAKLIRARQARTHSISQATTHFIGLRLVDLAWAEFSMIWLV